VSFHRAKHALFSLLAGFLNQLGLEKASKDDGQQDDHQGTADKLADHELPAQ
jgi:hypothetical protein